MREWTNIDMFQGPYISRTTIYRTIIDCEKEIPCLKLPKSEGLEY